VGRFVKLPAEAAGAAEATAALVRDEGQAAAVVLADVAAPDACASVVADSAAALGGLDGLVLNVGIGLGRGMAGTSAAQWDQTFAVNTPEVRHRLDANGQRCESSRPGFRVIRRGWRRRTRGDSHASSREGFSHEC
jgi:NAD(P)-dependent dehydrogenase (short-subunit alcohol dehydrogenase family)